MILYPADIRKLSNVICKDYNTESSHPNYLTASQLVEMFNSIGFKDDYDYVHGGIVASDMDELIQPPSRPAYTKRRLEDLNAKGNINMAIDAFLKICVDPKIAQSEINEVLMDNTIRSESTALKSNHHIPQVQSSVHQDFSTIDSLLDNIPNDVPVVFISYSWDNEEHKKWVRKLSDALRTDYSIYTLLDQYLRKGEDLVSFMMRGIEKANRVLVIGTPTYKSKSENIEQNGGVYFEDQIITISMYRGVKAKFIPILRKGSFGSSFNELLGVKNGFDFSEDTKYTTNLKALSDELWGAPRNAAPPLGNRPIL